METISGKIMQNYASRAFSTRLILDIRRSIQ